MEKKEADQGGDDAVNKLTVPILDGETGGANGELMCGWSEIDSMDDKEQNEDTAERKITNRESSLTESNQLNGQDCTYSKNVLEDEAHKVLEDEACKVLEDEACNVQAEEDSDDIFPGLDPWVPDTRPVAEVFAEMDWNSWTRGESSSRSFSFAELVSDHVAEPESVPEPEPDGYDSWLSDFDALDDHEDDLDMQLHSPLVTVHVSFSTDGGLLFVSVTMPQLVLVVVVSEWFVALFCDGFIYLRLFII